MENEKLISKGLSIKDDIANMDLVEGVRYAAGLSDGLRNISSNGIADSKEYWESLHIVEATWTRLVAELKDKMTTNLDERLIDLPDCKVFVPNFKKQSRTVIANISGIYGAALTYEWKDYITITFFQYVTDSHGQKQRQDIVLRRKALPVWLQLMARPRLGGLEKETTLENWVDVLISIIEELRRHDEEVAAFCKASSHIDESGNTVISFRTWKTSGRILSLSKEMPRVMVYHAKKNYQPYMDNDPSVHGSNGTYVENDNPYWILRLRIMRPSYEHPKSIVSKLDVHEYITLSLMPALGWGRITQERLDLLNRAISKVEMPLITHDTEKGIDSRDFIPIGFNGWPDYLNSIILPKIK